MRTEIKDIKQEKTTMQTTINNKTTEIKRLENVIQDKRREIINLQTEVTNAQNECKRLNKYIEEETVRISNKGDYSKITYIYSCSDKNMAEDKKNYAKEITLKSFNIYEKNYDRAKYVKNQLDTKYEGHWTVIIRIKDYGSFYTTYYSDCYLCFDIGEYEIDILKTCN